uniref:Candidate secreted effector n=1 Tax=Meloidogyne incognita TaxID=6306 RepID=A0A914MH54_MELIC
MHKETTIRIVVKHHSCRCCCNKGQYNVVLIVWSNKFATILIRYSEQIWSQHLYSTHFQLRIIKNCMKFYRGTCDAILS